MKISNPIQKIGLKIVSLAIIFAGLTLGQSVYASDDCIKPKVSGYDEVHCLDKEVGLAVVIKNEKMGFVDKTGKLIVKPIYDMPMQLGSVISGSSRLQAEFRNGLAIVSKNELNGLIDKSGKEVVPTKYYDLFVFNEHGYAVACEEEKKCGVINRQNKVIVPLDNEYATQFNEGLIVVYKNNHFYILNDKGSLEQTDYDKIYDELGRTFAFGTLVRKKDKFGMISTENGKTTIPIEYDDFVDGDNFAWFKKDGKTYNLDLETGKFVKE